MKRFVFNNNPLRVVLIVLSVILFSCTKEDRYVPEIEPVAEDNSFPFSITVGTGTGTRAGINSSGEYVFREGDMLFVANNDHSIRGELTLTSTAEEGRKGTFSGAFNEEPSDGTTLYVTLVSGNDKIHTLLGEAPYRYVVAERTYPTGAPGAIASSLEQAINWYSDFTGSFNYGETNSCNLSQESTFIEFNIRYLDIYVDSKAFGEDATIVFTNTDGSSDIPTDHREGIVPLTADEAGYAYSQCFVAFPGGTVLNGAKVTISSEKFPDMDFSINGATLQKSKKYNVKRDVVDEFSIMTTKNNTTITFNSYYLRSGAGVQYQIAPSEEWLSYTGPLTGLAKDVVVRFRAKRVDLGLDNQGEPIGVYDNQNNTNNEGAPWPSNAGHILFNFSEPVKVYGDIMSLLCDDNYQKNTYLKKHDFAGTFRDIKNMDIHEDRNLVLSAQNLSDGKKHYQNMFRKSSVVRGNHIVISAVTMGNYSCNSMFKDCSSMTTAPVLKSTTMAPYCYQSMFEGCSKLAEAPELPAENLAESCYRQMLRGTGIISVPNDLFKSVKALKPLCFYSMFSICTKLTNTPDLPFTNLETNCYACMFTGCTSLTTVPELPATTLAPYCYHNMFSDCTSLTSAPELPATTLADYCYRRMFSGCTKLTTATTLPAQTLSKSCYRSMFSGCKKLTTAPELPATTLGDSCYFEMFNGCMILTTAPTLSAETLSLACYEGMFRGDSLLTAAPTLPSTSLAKACYKNMFRGCMSLTESPILKAETLLDNCYEAMFEDCFGLKVVTCLAKNHKANHSTFNWLAGVKDVSSNIFRYNKDLGELVPEGWGRNFSGIPENWEAQPYYPE